MGLGKLMHNNGPGQVIWAVTNVCNAHCEFCSYPTGKGGKAAYVDFATAKKALDVMAARNWRILSFTGGEPLLNPDIYRIISYAVELGFVTRTGTNGRVLSAEVIKKLKATGLRNFWISIDSEQEEKHDANRGIPGLIAHIRKMVPLLKAEGISVNAAVPVNKLISNYEVFLDYLHGLGLDTVAFCYPMICMEASYGGAAESSLVEFTPGELTQVLKKIKELKKNRRGRTRIINPAEGLAEIINMQEGKTSRFQCLGGYKFFYLDWNLILFKCAFLAENYGSLLDVEPGREFPPSGCSRCMWQCFRDPSVYYHLLESMGSLKKAIYQGNFRRAAGIIGDRRNLDSARAWIGLARDRFYS